METLICLLVFKSFNRTGHLERVRVESSARGSFHISAATKTVIDVSGPKYQNIVKTSMDWV